MVAAIIQRDANGMFTPSGLKSGFMAPRLPPSTPRSPPQYADSVLDIPIGGPAQHMTRPPFLPPAPWMMSPPVQKEKGRWVCLSDVRLFVPFTDSEQVDLLIAVAILTLAIVRAITALSLTDIDVLGAFQALVWCLVAFFVTAPEANRLPWWDLSFATRSSLFDRGLLFVVAGLSNIQVEWILLGSDEEPKPTSKWPSYCLAAAISMTGIVYIVVHAKDFTKHPGDAKQAAFTPWMPTQPPFAPRMPDFYHQAGRGPPEKALHWMPPPSSIRTRDSVSTSKHYAIPESSARRHEGGPSKKIRRPPPARSTTETEYARSTRVPAPSTFVA